MSVPPQQQSSLVSRIDWKKFRNRLIVGFLQGNPDKVAAFLRGNLNKRLSVYSAAHLIDAIDRNQDLVGSMPETELNFVRGLMLDAAVKEAVVKFKDMITVDLVLQWWAVDRPDFAGVIVSYNYPRGREWLEQQLRIMKRQLLGV